MSGDMISHALVLAAGFGQRMRPLTDSTPKPLVRLGGKPMLDHVLDRLAEAGITDAIVNVHYLAGQIEAHLDSRKSPRITISDEREQILDTGGAVNKALQSLGPNPFFVHNSDSVWVEHGESTLGRMIEDWDGDIMDCLLLLASAENSLGYSGHGDFHMNDDGTLRRRAQGERAPYVFAGVSITKPSLFANCPDGPFSLNRIWDEAIAKGRLRAISHTGSWMHVGTPDALAAAERRLDGLDAA